MEHTADAGGHHFPGVARAGGGRFRQCAPAGISEPLGKGRAGRGVRVLGAWLGGAGGRLRPPGQMGVPPVCAACRRLLVPAFLRANLKLQYQ